MAERTITATRPGALSAQHWTGRTRPSQAAAPTVYDEGRRLLSRVCNGEPPPRGVRAHCHRVRGLPCRLRLPCDRRNLPATDVLGGAADAAEVRYRAVAQGIDLDAGLGAVLITRPRPRSCRHSFGRSQYRWRLRQCRMPLWCTHCRVTPRPPPGRGHVADHVDGRTAADARRARCDDTVDGRRPAACRPPRRPGRRGRRRGRRAADPRRRRHLVSGRRGPMRPQRAPGLDVRRPARHPGGRRLRGGCSYGTGRSRPAQLTCTCSNGPRARPSPDRALILWPCGALPRSLAARKPQCFRTTSLRP